MRKIYLLLTFLFSFYSEGISQNEGFEEAEKSPASFIEKDPLSKFQIGLNSQFIIDGMLDQSIRTPIEILFRRQDSHARSFRMRFSGIFQNSRRYELEYFNKTYESTLGLAIGYEWQQRISNRWNWYYGLEVEGRKFWLDELEEYDVVNQYTDETFHVIGINDQKTSRLSVLPLIGFKFRISSRLFVSSEFKLEAFTEKQDSRSGYDVKSVNASQQYHETSFEDFSTKGKNIHFQPYTGIFLNFIL